MIVTASTTTSDDYKAAKDDGYDVIVTETDKIKAVLALSLPCGGTAPDAVLCKELRALYKVMVPEPYCRGRVIFYGG